MAREAYKHLNKGGRIILMSSNTAHSFSVPRHSLYSASKGAIETFVRCLAKDTGDKKITINAVAPGGTVTDMFHATSHHYIPNGTKYTAEERMQVRPLPPSLFRVSIPHRTNTTNNRWPPQSLPSPATASPLILPALSASWPATSLSGLTARASAWTVVLLKHLLAWHEWEVCC